MEAPGYANRTAHSGHVMTTEQETIASLESDYPAWQVWTVHRAVGHTLWCARPWANTSAVVNLDSEQELRAYLASKETGE